MSTVTQLHDGNPDGNNFGSATTDKLGFYGLTTPIVQGSAITDLTTTAVTSETTAQWGFCTSTQGDAIATAVNAIIARLEALNLIAA